MQRLKSGRGLKQKWVALQMEQCIFGVDENVVVAGSFNVLRIRSYLKTFLIIYYVHIIILIQMNTYSYIQNFTNIKADC